MKIFKIDNTTFNGKVNKPANAVVTKVINSEPAKNLIGLAGLAGIGMATANLNQPKEKSYERTLEENYFQLPREAKPDVFQKASAAYLYNENDVLVTAPTGTGKTAIAHYVITKNLEKGQKTFYTTPLKALSNEKFKSFQKIYGEENVGLITGDTKVNKDAPIVIMTTEVYRNMIFGEQFKEHNPILDNLKTVIFDELHYLGDVDRGGVWEQSIIFSNPETQLLSLSATIGNNADIAKWMADSRGMRYYKPLISTQLGHNSDFNSVQNVPSNVVGLINVPTENRHVPLEFKNVLVAKDRLQHSRGKQNKYAPKIEKLSLKPQLPTNDVYKEMVTTLKKEGKLPAIFFIFSKRGCKNVLNHLAHYGDALNSEEEVKQINEIIGRYESEGKYLGESLNTRALEKGYAVHNSGLLPTQKELIEELFQKKLVKVVFATETLSAGINMPARTTVISSYMKPSSDPSAFMGMRKLTPNEFHQMAGRAGRRGIDAKGFCYTMSMDDEQKFMFNNLINSTPNALESAFNNLDYSFVAGYYDVCDTDDLIKEIAKRSFFAYDSNPTVANDKQKTFMKTFGLKRKVLRKFDYMDSAHNLTSKGSLLAKLNGYEQIPIINAIYSKRLGGLNPIELAGAIGAFANIQPIHESDSQNDETTMFSHENDSLEHFITTENNKLSSYNAKLAKLDSSHNEVEFNQDAVHHIYTWAELNDINESSTENWAKIMKKSSTHPIKDEGTLFKEISMTIDLLKQITEICDGGTANSQNILDEKYYNNLKSTAEAAIKLLSKAPIV